MTREDFVIRMRDALAMARAELVRFEQGGDDDLPVALILAFATPCQHEQHADHWDFQRLREATNQEDLDFLYEDLEADARGEMDDGDDDG